MKIKNMNKYKIASVDKPQKETVTLRCPHTQKHPRHKHVLQVISQTMGYRLKDLVQALQPGLSEQKVEGEVKTATKALRTKMIERGNGSGLVAKLSM